jgi:cysteine desulfurase/selenocysteine lyase
VAICGDFIVASDTEGLNIAANCLPLQPGDTVLLSGSEHPNNVYCWLNLEKKGIRVKWIPTEAGQVTVELLRQAIDDSTRVLAVAATTYAPGNRNDLKALVQICREYGIYTVVDAVQSVGTMKVDVQELGMDVLCTSGHKSLFCPHGVGLVYIRRELLPKLDPVYVARSGMGMAAQVEQSTVTYQLAHADSARKFEIGNYNYLGVTVLNESLKFLLGLGMERVQNHILSIYDYLASRLQKAGFHVASPISGPLRSAILCFEADDARELHGYLMDNKAITTLRRGMIRASIGLYNNREDVDAFVQLLERHYQRRQCLAHQDTLW